MLIDGSPFRWFDETGPACSLPGAIDDATGEILALTFRPSEDLHGDAVLLRELLATHGVPVALYGDRSGVLVRNDAHWTLEEEPAGRQTPPQFGQMLEGLGLRFIAATSPQAKGRIERLWGTLQDRPASELRRYGHTTVATAGPRWTVCSRIAHRTPIPACAGPPPLCRIAPQPRSSPAATSTRSPIDGHRRPHPDPPPRRHPPLEPLYRTRTSAPQGRSWGVTESLPRQRDRITDLRQRADPAFTPGDAGR